MNDKELNLTELAVALQEKVTRITECKELMDRLSDGLNMNSDYWESRSQQRDELNAIAQRVLARIEAAEAGR